MWASASGCGLLLSSFAGFGFLGWSGVLLGLDGVEKGLILQGFGIIFKKN